MTVRQAVADARRAQAFGIASLVASHAASRIAAGQVTLLDLRAGSSLVAVEGALRICWRDHALAWLGDAVPPLSLTLYEGGRFVVPQHGIVSISASEKRAASFIVLSSDADRRVLLAMRRVVRRVAVAVDAVKARWRRAV